MAASRLSGASFRSLGQYSLYNKSNGSCRININSRVFF